MNTNNSGYLSVCVCQSLIHRQYPLHQSQYTQVSIFAVGWKNVLKNVSGKPLCKCMGAMSGKCNLFKSHNMKFPVITRNMSS